MQKRTVRQTRSALLSVRVEPSERRALRQVMRDEGLASESETVRMLVRRAAQRREAEALVARLRKHRWRGPLVNASEDHDRLLAGTKP